MLINVVFVHDTTNNMSIMIIRSKNTPLFYSLSVFSTGLLLVSESGIGKSL